MSGSPRVLELSLVTSRLDDRERAELLVDRLASRRRLSGEAPRWRVVYEAADITAAMALCEAELGELDPGWLEFLDFRALPSRPLRDVEFG